MSDFIRGDSSCPDPHAVEAEVFRLTSPEGRAAYLPGAQARVFDEGDGYGVEIQKGNETYRKTYDDPGRACDQRARVVAVTVVMTLIPAEFSSEAPGAAPGGDTSSATPGAAAAAQATEPHSEEQTPAAAPGPAVAEPAAIKASQASEALVSADESGGLGLEAGAWFQHSVSSSEVPRIAAWGGELLASWGTARVAGLLAASGGASSNFDLGDLRASLVEASARTGARVLWPLSGATLGLDAAFVVARRQVAAEGSRASDAQAAWELGGSLGTNVSFDVSRWWAPVAGIRLNVFPVPSELAAAPRGAIGTLPKFWLGAHAGVRFDL